ncbi:MAG TPA: acyl-CoA dehydrogenase, partial [Gemmatimonadaceae bacterium]|nr:acyl-CoA dehydrogenase [Gemmatimonadaceae bacterium]
GLCDGSLVAANAMTEPGSGSDAFALVTRADLDTDGFVLNGAKTFASNAPCADVFITYASNDSAKGYHGGVTAFIVPRKTPGFRTGPRFRKLGLRSSHMGEVIFENALVSHDAVLGTVGGGGPIFAQSMDWERVCLGAIHVGAMQRLLESCIRHARTHKVGGTAIGKSQSVSHRIADMKVRLDASRTLMYRAAASLETSRNVSMDAAIAKLFVSESFVACAQSASAIFADEGVIAGHEAERTLRDALASTIYSGTSEIQRNIISRWLGL